MSHCPNCPCLPLTRLQPTPHLPYRPTRLVRRPALRPEPRDRAGTHLSARGRKPRVVAAVSGGSDSVALVASAASARWRRRAAAGRARPFQSPAAARGGWGRGVLREAGRALDRPVPGRRRRRAGAGRARAPLHRRRGARPRATSSSSVPASQLGADVVALGHTRDDQAETFLLRLLRGAGSRGSGRCTRATARIIRPLLGLPASRAAAYLAGPRHQLRARTNRTPTSASRATGFAPSCCRCSPSASTRRLSTCLPTRPSWRARSGSGWTTAVEALKRGIMLAATDERLVIDAADAERARRWPLARAAMHRFMTAESGGRADRLRRRRSRASS